MSGRPGRRIATLGAVIALVALPACWTGGSGSDGLRARAAVPGASGRNCLFVDPVDAAPPFGDLARLGTRGNIALWGRGMELADTVELSVRYAEDGALYWVEAIRSTVAAERVEALEELMLEAMDEMGRSDWGVRLLVVGGDLVDVAPSVVCEPEVRLASNLPSGIGNDARARAIYRQIQGRRIPVQITLDELGRVLNVRLLRSTHSRLIDEYIRDHVWNSAFEPKLHDGIGVVTTFEMDLHFPRRRRVGLRD